MPLRKEIYVVYGRVFVRYIRGVGNITTISWTENKYTVFANQGREILKLNPYKMAFPQFFWRCCWVSGTLKNTGHSYAHMLHAVLSFSVIQ